MNRMSVKHLGVRVVLEAALIRIPVDKHAEHLPDQNLDIEEERPILDIPQIVLGALADRGVATQAIDLCPAGHPRLLFVALHIAWNRTLELLDIDRALWPRSDQAHVADQYVNQLRQFIKVRAAQE